MIFIIFIVVLFGLIFGIPLLSQSENNGCQEDAKVCPDETVVVREGKNCDFQPCPNTEENRVYCKSEDRDSDICTFLYDPVCAYPEKQTSPNSCVACSDEKVEYWVAGICE